MSIRRKILAALAALTLIFGVTTAAVTWAGAASATTLTCTNVNNALVSPFGCGGLQESGATLDLAHAANFYNGLVTVMPDASNVTEDWTAFAVVPISHIPTTPGGHITGGPGGYGVYVAMDTPGGNIPSFTPTTDMTCLIGGNSVTREAGTTYTNTEPCPAQPFIAGPQDLCLSVENAAHVPGTNGKLRWWTVLRSCNTNDEGAFVYGRGPLTEGGQSAPGTVDASHYNAFQAWAPLGPGGGGFIMDNVWLFQHNNVPYVLDVTGNGGATTAVQAFPLHGVPGDSAVPWEEWNIIGCTPPASLLNVGAPYVNCP